MSLGRARWQAASPYLDQALDLTPEARPAWLAALRHRDAALAADVEALLSAHVRLREEHFLEDGGEFGGDGKLIDVGLLDAGWHLRAGRDDARAAWPAQPWSRASDGDDANGRESSERDAADRALGGDALDALDAPGAGRAGEVVGAYRLVSHIGQGGMGTVWLAERCDGRFEGRAAVKLLNAGLVGRSGEARFRREGSILARLTHPHVAHLVDAGLSSTGQPFLILEYVDGERLDDYCARHALGIDARLRLFLDVLAAVTYAHAKLIVHRDLKPSNVLVTRDGQVKLLDFGIATLLERDPHETNQASARAHDLDRSPQPPPSREVTARESTPRETPPPEATLTREGRAALTPQYAAPEQVTGGDVTTATDVYALGVLLYLLLTRQHPVGDRAQTRAELLDAIVQSQPRRPSEAAGDPATARLLRGDLDTIVMKALEKRPEDRYASAAALADDISRHLTHRPIAARPATLAYRADKFVRRNRVPVALAALVAIALIAGLVGTITQARRAHEQAARADAAARTANAQRDFAVRQLSRAEAIRSLNEFLLSDASPSGAPFTVGTLLRRAEQIIDRQKGETTENRVEMLMSIGRQYYMQTELADATRVLTRAYDLAGTIPDRSFRGRAACELAAALARAGQPERATQLMQGVAADLPDEPQFAFFRVTCLVRGASVASNLGQTQTGIDLVLQARALNRATVGSAVLDFAIAHHLGEAYRLAGRLREADAAFREAAAGETGLGLDDTQTAGGLFNNWGLVLQALGRPLEGERLLRRAIRIGSADKTENGVRPIILNNLARLLRELHRLDEAADYAERAYTRARETSDELTVSQSLMLRAALFRERGDLARGEAATADLAARLTRMLPKGHVAFAQLAMEQALNARARGDLTRAATLMDRAVSIAEASGQSRQYLPSNLVRRANLRLEQHQADAARADAERALEMEQRTLGPDPKETPKETKVVSSRLGRVYLALGRAHAALGHTQEADAALTFAVAHLEPTVGADHPDTQLARRLISTARP